MKNLESILLKIGNNKITEVICGGSNGSVVILTMNQEISLTIHCVWRLSDKQKVLASWNEEYSRNLESNFVSQLQSLEGDFIEVIEKSKFNDLIIKFKSGKEFTIFCDLNTFYGDYFDNNWEICDKTLNYCISINREHQETFDIYNTSIV